MTRYILIAAALVVLAGQAWGQVGKPLDWKSCTDVTDTFKAVIEKFNAAHHDGFSIEASCRYSGDPKRMPLERVKVALTPSEVDRLHSLRRTERAGYEAMDEYEEELFRAHGIRKPDLHEPCYFFAGIIVDEDYITVDPNPMMATDDCVVNWKIKPSNTSWPDGQGGEPSILKVRPSPKPSAKKGNNMKTEGPVKLKEGNGKGGPAGNGGDLTLRPAKPAAKKAALNCNHSGPCDDTPITLNELFSVPAVRKTRKVCVMPSMVQWDGNQCDKFGDEQYWICLDPDRSLLVSENGKHAACLKVNE